MKNPLPASAGNSIIVVAVDVLSGKVCDLIALVVTPIPCTSGAALSSELPSDLLRSVLSKKSAQMSIHRCRTVSQELL